MEIIELKNKIKKKEPLPFLVLTGLERTLMYVYIDKIAQVYGAKKQTVDSVAAIYSTAKNHSIVAQRKIYIVQDDKDYLTAEKKWEELAAGVVQGNNIVVLIYLTLDKRSKFYKAISDNLVSFDKMVPEALKKTLSKTVALNDNALDQLISLCDCDYGRLLLECDKLQTLQQATGLEINACYTKALNEGLIPKALRDVMFDFVNAFCKRQAVQASQLWQELLIQGSSPVVALSLLYNTFRSMLIVAVYVKDYGSTKDIVDKTGLTGWEVKIATEKGNAYSIDELLAATHLIREAERGIKQGTLDIEIAIDYLMVNIF